MYSKYLIKSLFVLLLFACSTQQVIVVNKKLYTNQEFIADSLIASHKIIDNFTIDKAKLLLDYDGYLRSLKATLSAKIDSFTHINIFTSFGQPVATLHTEPEFLYFIDHQYKTVHRIDYLTLSSKTKVYLSQREIQNFLFGIPEVDAKTLNPMNSQRAYMLIDNTFEIEDPLEYKTDSLDLRLYHSLVFHPQYLNLISKSLKDGRRRTLIQATYKERKKNSLNGFPDVAMIMFTYDGKDVEVDIDYRSFPIDNFDKPTLDSAIDSTYVINYIK